MPLSLLRKMSFAAICMAGVSGCLPTSDGSTTQRGFVSNGLGSSFSLNSGTRRATLANGDVKVKTPAGYCVDESSVNNGSFLLLVDCAVLKQSAKSSPASRGLITVSVSAPMPGGPDLSDTSQTVENVSERLRSGRGVTLMRLTEGGDALIPGASPTYWRALVAINNRAVTLAAYGPERGALAGDAGRNLLSQLADNILKASPKRNEQPIVASLPAAPSVSTETVQ